MALTPSETKIILGGLQYNTDDANRLSGNAAAANSTAENSYVRAFHMVSRWHRYKLYATSLVTASGCILAESRGFCQATQLFEVERLLFKANTREYLLLTFR
jgi:hypothetical protein